MDFSELNNALGIENGTLKTDQITIASNTLTSNLGSLLAYCYDNQPLVIRRAEFVSADADNNRVTIKGQSTFLNVAQLETEAHFSIDTQGQVQLFLKYALIGNEPLPNRWKFSTSFPNLPKVPDQNEAAYFDRATQGIIQSMIVPLDGLILFNSFFVVVSQPQKEPALGVDLQWGINFVGYLRPQGYLAIIETLFAHTAQLTVFGTIRRPRPTETPQQLALQYASSLERFQYPWSVVDDFPNGLPGILLQVALDIDYTIINDKLKFRGETLYLYTPLDDSWLLLNTNPNFVPIQAYVGSIELSGTGITVDVVSPIQIGVDELTIIGTFEGVSLHNLSQLVGLTGTGESPLQQLPTEIQNLGDQFGKLELINTRVDIEYATITSVNVSYISFTIGMPELKWHVWDEHFVIDNIYCAFDILYPLSTITDPDIGRDLRVVVYGRLEIEQVPFAVYASNQDGFTVYAEMAEKQTLPLKKIMEIYAPGVPPPSDLTINIFRVGIAPQKAYSMALAMAQEPEPWVLPIGPSSLTIADVAISFVYPKGGPIQGSVSGIAEFGNFARLSIVYDLPGDIIIRGGVPEITLSQMVSRLCNESIEFPGGFDLTFLNSSVLIQKQNSNLVFQFATTLEGFGSLAFEARKIPSGWGFAFGLAISTGEMSKLQGLGDFVSIFEEWFPFRQMVLIISSFKDSAYQFPNFQQFDNRALSQSTKITLPAAVQGIDRGFYFYGKLIFDRKNKILAALIDLLKIPEGTELDLMMAYLIDQKRFQLGVSLVTYLTPSQTSTSDYVRTRLVGTLFADIGGGDGLQFGLSATLKTLIQGTEVDFNVTLATVSSGFFVSGTMDTKRPIDFGPFQLADVAIELGISYSTLLPSFGFAASLEVEGLFHSSIAVLIDTTKPSQSMAAGSLSDLTLQKIVDKLVGEPDDVPTWLNDVLAEVSISGPEEGAFSIPVPTAVIMATALNEFDGPLIAQTFQTYGKLSVFPSSSEDLTIFRDDNGRQWYVTSLTGAGESSLIEHYQLHQNEQTGEIDVTREAQFYCVLDPAGSWIGKFYYGPGIKISGVLEFLLLKVEVDVEINQNRGIKIDAHMDPIVLLHKQFFSITQLDDLTQGPYLSLLTYQNGTTEPHFHVDGQITLLGQGFGIKVNITKEGLDFRIERSVFGVVTFTLYGTVDDPENFSIGGSISVDFSDSPVEILGLDKVVNEIADANVEIGVRNGTPFATASFHVLGEGVEINFEIEDGFTKVEELFREGIEAAFKKCALTTATLGLM